MLLAGSEDGVHRLTGIDEPGDVTVEKVLDTGSVMRIRKFDEFTGVFAATESGLYHSPTGEEWSNLDVPREKVYAVGASPDGSLYAGTRPAHIYVARAGGEEDLTSGVAWQELDGFHRAV